MDACALAAIIATESEGVTKNCLPRIMFLSPSPGKIIGFINFKDLVFEENVGNIRFIIFKNW